METSFSRINLYLGLVQETWRKPCEVSNHLEEQAQLSFLKDLIPNRTLQNYFSWRWDLTVGQVQLYDTTVNIKIQDNRFKLECEEEVLQAPFPKQQGIGQEEMA